MKGCTCGWGGVHDPDNPRCELYVDPVTARRAQPVTVGELADALRAAAARADATARLAETRVSSAERRFGQAAALACYALGNALVQVADALEKPR